MALGPLHFRSCDGEQSQQDEREAGGHGAGSDVDDRMTPPEARAALYGRPERRCDDRRNILESLLDVIDYCSTE